MNRVWLELASLIRGRYLWIIGVTVVALVVLALGIPRLRFKSSQDAIVSSSSQVYQDSLAYQREFGGDPMLVLFEGDVLTLLSPANLGTLQALEGELRARPDVFTVVSPLTVLEGAVVQLPLQQELAAARLAADQEAAANEAREKAVAEGLAPAAQEDAAAAARQQVAGDFAARRQSDALRLGQVGPMTANNPRFAEFVLLEADGSVRPEVQDLVFDRQHSLMVVRLAGNMSIDEQAKAAGEIVDVVRRYRFGGVEALPSGPPVLIKEINDRMRTSMLQMAGIVVGLMVVVLSLLFRVRWRLLSLPIVLVGVVLAFGLMGYLSLPLTMVTISGLPILIGLGVDFAIQFHNRFEEEAHRRESAGAALQESLLGIGPAIVVALLAAAVGFMTLHISRVPMIRDFGSMLTVGTVIVFLAVFFLLNTSLFLRDRRRAVPVGGTAQQFQVERVMATLSRNTVGRVLPIVAVGLFIALIGLLVDSRIPMQSDPERFIPQDSGVLQELYRIRDAAGSSSELTLFVQADDATRPEVLSWMAQFQARMLKEHPELIRVNSLANLLMMGPEGTPLAPDLVARALATSPDDARLSLVSADGGKASIIFSIEDDVSLAERKVLLDQIRSDLGAPEGVTAAPAGLSVIGVAAVDALSQNRNLMVFAAVGAIVVGLFLVYRQPVKAVAPVFPILLALGASSVILYLLGIELNPLTAVSGPLIVAMGTEFTLLLMSRYFEERERGLRPREAMHVASLRIGRAIAASGLTVVAGFGALAFSNFPLLVDFGKVTALDMGLAVLSTLVVLPPLLVWLDEGAGLLPVEKRLRPAE